MRAKRVQLRREFNERAWMIWHMAALQRTKKLPPLSSISVPEPRRRQTWQEQLAIAHRWVALGLGKITKGP